MSPEGERPLLCDVMLARAKAFVSPDLCKTRPGEINEAKIALRFDSCPSARGQRTSCDRSIESVAARFDESAVFVCCRIQDTKFACWRIESISSCPAPECGFLIRPMDPK